MLPPISNQHVWKQRKKPDYRSAQRNSETELYVNMFQKCIYKLLSFAIVNFIQCHVCNSQRRIVLRIVAEEVGHG